MKVVQLEEIWTRGAVGGGSAGQFSNAKCGGFGFLQIGAGLYELGGNMQATGYRVHLVLRTVNESDRPWCLDSSGPARLGTGCCQNGHRHSISRPSLTPPFCFY